MPTVGSAPSEPGPHSAARGLDTVSTAPGGVRLPEMVTASVPPAHPARSTTEQEIRFCRGSGGVRIAYAVHGSGPPLVVVSCWLSHLQHDWQSPVWRHFLDDLGGISTLVRYDERGFGMSDWTVEDFSLDARVGDLEGVIAALDLDRVALLGMSGGSEVAMAYAARQPEKVTRLILYGTGSGAPAEMDPEERAVEDTFRSMIRVGWAREDPLFRRVFTRMFIPNATEQQMQWFDALQRMSTSPENAVASRISRQAVDITDEIPRITAPTLVLQALGDRATPFSNAPGVAGRIPMARLVPLDSRNHILLADEPAWSVWLHEVGTFLEADRAELKHSRVMIEHLSQREIEVLRSAAEGMTNQEIAESLGLSVRTVERHLSNAYGKLGVAGKAARAAAVADLLRQRLG
jgi:pimeloyl-ACP methyl ester carboxylesterase/DNA-binding CsgD family transcriptional regulator